MMCLWDGAGPETIGFLKDPWIGLPTHMCRLVKGAFNKPQIKVMQRRGDTEGKSPG